MDIVSDMSSFACALSFMCHTKINNALFVTHHTHSALAAASNSPTMAPELHSVLLLEVTANTCSSLAGSASGINDPFVARQFAESHCWSATQTDSVLTLIIQTALWSLSVTF